MQIFATIILSAMLTMSSWYGPGFHGNLTANGEVFDQNEITAAHRYLPFDTVLRVSHGDDSIHVRVNDRGPYDPGAVARGVLAPHPTRGLDLSKAAFAELAPLAAGVIEVEVKVIGIRGGVWEGIFNEPYTPDNTSYGVDLSNFYSF